MHSLGVVYKQLDKWKESRMYYERCLDGREKALGKEHADTLTTQVHHSHSGPLTISD